MAEYDNELRGALFTNDKGGVEKRPDYRGTMQIEGVTYKIAGWRRNARSSNKPFVSLSFTPEVTDPPVTTEDDFLPTGEDTEAEA